MVQIDEVDIYVFGFRLFEGVGWTMKCFISENPKVSEETPSQVGEGAKPNGRGTSVVGPCRLQVRDEEG